MNREFTAVSEIFYGIYLGTQPMSISKDFHHWITNGFGRQSRLDWQNNRTPFSEMFLLYCETRYGKDETQWPEELRSGDVWLEEYLSKYQDRRIAVVHHGFTTYTDERGEPVEIIQPTLAEASVFNRDIKTFCKALGITYDKPSVYVISHQRDD